MKKQEVVEGFMPTTKQLEGAGEPGLIHSIRQLGGVKRVADSMLLRYSTTQYPTLTLTAKAYKLWAQHYHNMTPTRQALQLTGNHELASACRKFGFPEVRAAAGLPKFLYSNRAKQSFMVSYRRIPELFAVNLAMTECCRWQIVGQSV